MNIAHESGCGAGCEATVTHRTPHMSRTHMLRFGATHEAVAEVGVIDCVLREQVPAKVLFVARAPLRRVGAGVTNMPHMPWETVLVHRLADAAIPHIAHLWHHLAIECANALQFVTGQDKASEGCAGRWVELLR